MPYRRRGRSYRRRRAPRNVFYKRGANKALRLARMAIGMLNSEKKYIDFSNNAFTIPITGTMILLNPLIQGTTATTRIGNQVRCKNVLMRFNLTLDSNATRTYIRCMLLWDRQPNGALPGLDDILETVGTGGMVVNSPLERDFAFRFKLLRDKRYTVYTDKPIVFVKWFIRLGRRIRYDDSNAGDITDIATNSLIFVMVSTEATNTPGGAIFSRLRFIDN